VSKDRFSQRVAAHWDAGLQRGSVMGKEFCFVVDLDPNALLSMAYRASRNLSRSSQNGAVKVTVLSEEQARLLTKTRPA
jgi:hypothetical protein